MPQVGQIVDGYKFKGGNPNDQNAWEPVSAAPSTGPNIGDVVDGYRFTGGNPNDQAAWELDAPMVTQEMHPSLTLKDRLVVKNLSNSPDASLAYLQKNHPDLEVQNLNGQIIVRKPGEQTYKVLDPDTGFFSKDFLMDAADIAYDVGSGIAEGAATTAGGIAGFASPVPGGTLMGAAGAGGAASAASEALRQKLGQLAGIPQEMDYGQVGMSGVIGAASPLLFGVDKMPGAKQAVKETAEEALKREAVEQASEGLLKKGGIKLASLATGIEDDTLREGYKRLSAIKEFEKTGVTDFVEETHDDIKSTLFEAKTQVGKDIGQKITNAGESVNVSSAKNKIKDLIKEYEEKANILNTPGMKEKLAEVRGVYDELFKVGKNAEVKNVSADVAFELQQQLADLAELHKSNAGIMSRFSKKGVGDKRLANAATDAYKDLAKAIEETIDKAGEKTGTLKELKNKYAELSRLQKDIAPKFASPEKTYNTLRTISGKNKQFFYEKIKKMDETLGTNVADKAKDLEVYSLFSKASPDAISTKGSTSTSRSIPLAIAGGTIGYGIGGFPGGAIGSFLGAKAGSPAAMRLGMEALTPINRARKAMPNIEKQSIWNLMNNRNEAE